MSSRRLVRAHCVPGSQQAPCNDHMYVHLRKVGSARQTDCSKFILNVARTTGARASSCSCHISRLILPKSRASVTTFSFSPASAAGRPAAGISAIPAACIHRTFNFVRATLKLICAYLEWVLAKATLQHTSCCIPVVLRCW